MSTPNHVWGPTMARPQGVFAQTDYLQQVCKHCALIRRWASKGARYEYVRRHESLSDQQKPGVAISIAYSLEETTYSVRPACVAKVQRLSVG